MNSHDAGRESRLLRIRDVAALCAVSARRIRRWMEAGLMPRPNKIGGSLRFSVVEIEKWINGGCNRERE